MVLLLVLTTLWLLVAPFIILSKVENMEARLAKAMKEKISESEERLKQQLMELRLEMARAEISSSSQPEAPPDILLPNTDNSPSWEKVSAVPAYEMPREYETMPAEIEPASPEFHFAEAGNAETIACEDITAEPTVLEDNLQQKPEREFVTREPSILDQSLSKFLSWLLKEGNIWVCAGVFLFLVGFGLLFKYAIQRGVLTLEMRLAAAAVTGIAMTWFGFRLGERRRAYGLTLQGGGMGVLYLVVLAASKYNQLSTGQPILPPVFAVAAMLVLSVFTVLLAMLQDYQPLALFAILGGFAAPILVSTGSRNYVALFSIYSLLNLEILVLSLKRDWRILSRMGFVISISIGTAWGINDWRPELFNSVEPFLLIFFVTYTLIAIASGHRKGGGNSVPDLLLAVSAPFGFFALQTQVAGHTRYGMALTCLGLGLWHLLFGAWLRREKEGLESESRKTRLTLSNLYIFLCLLFSNLVAAYTFDNSTASAVWAVEGAFLVTAACRTGSYKALFAGIALHAAALVFYGFGFAGLDWNAEARLSPILVSGALFAFSLLCSGFGAAHFRPKAEGLLYDKWEDAIQKICGVDGAWARGALSWTFTVLGALWLWGTICDQVPRLDTIWFSVLSASCLAALAGSWLSVRFNWKAARFLLTNPVVWASFHSLYIVWDTLKGTEFPFRHFDLLLLPVVGYMQAWHMQIDVLTYAVCVGGSLYILSKAESTAFPPFTTFAAMLSGLFLTNYAIQQIDLLGSWNLPLSILPVIALLLCLRRFRWPSQKAHKEDAAVAAYAAVWFMCFQGWRFVISFSWPDGAAGGIFIPVLNPLELWQAGILLSLFLWVKIFAMEGLNFGKWPNLAQFGFAALFFVWLNQVAVRASWHYWGETQSYIFMEVLRTASCQAIIAIVWGVTGLSAILYGQKTRSRALWCAGAALVAADMVKLFLVDLNRAATLVRIMAFLVLGGLSLLIGWVAPLPPKKTGTGEE